MINLESILCPTNLSPESDEALRYAVALALAYDAKLYLCYCAEVGAPAGTPDEIKSAFATAIMPHMGLASSQNLKWEGIVAENGKDAGEEIVREARERGVDLIVMRSRRRPRMAAVLGSTAETVSRTAPCPVMVTHPQEREWVGRTTGQIDLQRVLVAYDFSDDAELSLSYARLLAEEHGAELHLLHVLAPPEEDGPEIAWGAASKESAYHQASHRLQQAAPKEVKRGGKTTAVRWGKTYQEVLAYAKEHEIDLICMGANGSNHSRGALFGSNVDRVLRQSPCPLLVARPLKPALAALPALQF